MSIKNLTFTLVFLSVGIHSASATAVRCPRSLGKHAFEHVSLFNEDPAELADTIPINGRWDVSKPATNDEGWFLVCYYKRTSKTKTFRVPPSAIFCDVSGFCQ